MWTIGVLTYLPHLSITAVIAFQASILLIFAEHDKSQDAPLVAAEAVVAVSAVQATQIQQEFVIMIMYSKLILPSIITDFYGQYFVGILKSVKTGQFH